MSFIIARPRKIASKTTDAQYVMVSTPSGAVRVILDDAILEDWSDIKTMEFDFVAYTKQTIDGKLVDQDWQRLECVNYTLRADLLADAKFEAEIAKLGVRAVASAELNAEEIAEGVAAL